LDRHRISSPITRGKKAWLSKPLARDLNAWTALRLNSLLKAKASLGAIRSPSSSRYHSQGVFVEAPFPDLVCLFDELPSPREDTGLGRFMAQPVSGYPSCSVGKDSNGNPVLLIEADSGQAGPAFPL